MSTQQKKGQNMFCRMTNDSTHNEKRYFYSILAPLSRTQDILHMYGKHQKQNTVLQFVYYVIK